MDARKLNEFLKAQKERANRNNRQATKFLKLKNGEQRFVILPGWQKDKPEVFCHPYGAHWYVVPGRKSKAGGDLWNQYLCNEKTHDQPCDFCRVIRETAQSINDDGEAKEFLRRWGAQQTYLFNVLALDSEVPNEPQVLQVCKTVFEQVMDNIGKWGTRIFDEKNPQVISIRRTKLGAMKVEYVTTISPETYDMPNGVLDKLHDLDALCVMPADDSFARIVSAMNMNVANILPAPARDPIPALESARNQATSAEIVEEDEDVPFENRPAESSVGKKEVDPVGLGDDFEKLLSL